MIFCLLGEFSFLASLEGLSGTISYIYIYTFFFPGVLKEILCLDQVVTDIMGLSYPRLGCSSLGWEGLANID